MVKKILISTIILLSSTFSLSDYYCEGSSNNQQKIVGTCDESWNDYYYLSFDEKGNRLYEFSGTFSPKTKSDYAHYLNTKVFGENETIKITCKYINSYPATD
jgi:hypothetical protein